MTDRSVKDALFVRLSIDVLEDERINELSMLGQLVYLRGLLHAKRAARDGLVSARSIRSGLFAAPITKSIQVDEDPIPEVLDELVASGLWELAESGQYRIAGWLKHNDSVADIEERREAARMRKVRGGHKSNHKLGRHEDRPVENCPTCEENGAFPQVGTVASDQRSLTVNGERSVNGDDRPIDETSQRRLATGIETETESDLETDIRSQKSETETEVRSQRQSQNLSATSAANPSGADESPGETGIENPSEIAGKAFAAAGITAEPDAGIIRSVERALDRGHTATAIVAKGSATAEAKPGSLVGYLRKALDTTANSDPKPTTARRERAPSAARVAAAYAKAEARVAAEANPGAAT